MPKLVARTTLPLGSCTAMTSVLLPSSGVLVGTSTGQVIFGTYIRGRIRLKALDGIVGTTSPIATLDCRDTNLLVIRHSCLLQIYQLRLKDNSSSDLKAHLQHESAVDEAPKFRPLFIDKKTLFVIRERSVYNIFDTQEKIPTLPVVILGMIQLVYDKSCFLLYGEGLMLWKWTRLTKFTEASAVRRYALQLQTCAILESEVMPCILHLCIKDNLVFCATNMGVLLYFPEEQIMNSLSEAETVIYVKIYPMVVLSVRNILHWGDYLVPCGGYALELLSVRLYAEQLPEVVGTPVMSFEDQCTCASVLETLLWICVGGASICILSN